NFCESSCTPQRRPPHRQSPPPPRPPRQRRRTPGRRSRHHSRMARRPVMGRPDNRDRHHPRNLPPRQSRIRDRRDRSTQPPRKHGEPMTAHPIDTEALRREAQQSEDRRLYTMRVKPQAMLDFLDLLAAAEHRATRAEAQSAIRGRAVVIYRERAREAEAERDEWREASVELAASSNQANADL